MAKYSDKSENGKLDVKDVRKKFTLCEEFYSQPYERGEEDGEFVLGDQWPEDIRSKRYKEGRPCLTENRMLPFVNNVINQIRQARPSIVVRPVDDGADVETAEIYRGIIRNIESVSSADVVYDTAARNSVMNGIGWIRVGTDYADYDTFDQEAFIDRIQNFQSCYLDPNAQRLDGADAEYGFVFTDMSKEEYERKYPDYPCESFDNAGIGWLSDKTVRIAEYFYKDYEEKTLVEYDLMGKVDTAYSDELPDGAIELRSRKTHVCKIKYAKISGAPDPIEEGEFPGQFIPLVPVYGFEAFVDGRRTFYSLIHQAKDPQMMLNFWKSANTEIMALQPKAPYIGAVGQFKTYKSQWASANTANFPFLEYDPVTVMGENGEVTFAPPPQRQQPPVASVGMQQEAAINADAIKACLGMYDASMGQATPDISGKAILTRQMQGDNATFHFVDNLSVAIRHVGRILIDIIPVVYSGARIVRILGEDGEETMMPLGQPVVKDGDGYKPAKGVADKNFNLRNGKYDVAVEVGPSYATKRQEAANAMLQLVSARPENFGVFGDLMVKSLDFPMADEIAKRIKATMPPELLGDDVEAMRLQQMTQALNELQNKLQLTEQALLAKQQNEEFKNSLEAKKVENDTIKLQIEAAKTQAEIEKMQAETRGVGVEAVAEIAQAIMDLKSQTDDVSNALAMILNSEDEATGVPETPVQEGENYVRPDIASQ